MGFSVIAFTKKFKFDNAIVAEVLFAFLLGLQLHCIISKRGKLASRFCYPSLDEHPLYVGLLRYRFTSNQRLLHLTVVIKFTYVNT